MEAITINPESLQDQYVQVVAGSIRWSGLETDIRGCASNMKILKSES